jgi:hypothetical protein
VVVPAPERFAVHKLILAEERRNDPLSAVKAGKDLAQAALLIEALAATGRAVDLGFALDEAENRGEGWRRRLRVAETRLDPAIAAHLAVARTVAAGLR